MSAVEELMTIVDEAVIDDHYAAYAAPGTSALPKRHDSISSEDDMSDIPHLITTAPYSNTVYDYFRPSSPQESAVVQPAVAVVSTDDGDEAMASTSAASEEQRIQPHQCCTRHVQKRKFSMQRRSSNSRTNRRVSNPCTCPCRLCELEKQQEQQAVVAESTGTEKPPLHPENRSRRPTPTTPPTGDDEHDVRRWACSRRQRRRKHSASALAEYLFTELRSAFYPLRKARVFIFIYVHVTGPKTAL